MNRQITTEDARRIVRHPGATLAEISAAARILEHSADPSDRIIGRNIIRELGDQIQHKAKPRNDLCRRLSDAPDLPAMAANYAAMQDRRANGGRIRLALAVFLVFLVGLVAALTIQAAWGKTARTLIIFEQIEALK